MSNFSSALTQVISHTHESFVINLEAPWGQGKTTFLEMWRHHLRSQRIDTLYFNAWENDFAADPLIALIGELSAGMESMRVDASSPAWKHLEKIKKIGARVAVRSLPALVKAGTFGALDLTDVVEEALAGATEKIAEEEIKRYQDAKNSIGEFRNELAKFANQLALQNESTNPLVVIIDELDRCKPDYAIKILETVKHLFAVPGVVFVVATDSRQLSNAIKHVYGLEAAAEDYLRRFFDLSVSLPSPSTKQFVEALFARHNLGDFFAQRTHPDLRYDREQAMATFVAMCEATECSLRDQQKCFILLTISVRSLEQNAYLHPVLLCILIVLRVKRHSLFDQFVAGRIGATELVDVLSTNSAGRAFFSSTRGYGSTAYAYLITSMVDRSKRDVEIKELEKRAEAENGGNDSEFAKQVIAEIRQYSFRSSAGALKNVLPRIEFFARPSHPSDDW